MNLVIVESPTKARTISRFLDRGDRVLSSYGHIRDLPGDEFGIDIENDFKPEYHVIEGKKKVIQKIKSDPAITSLPQKCFHVKTFSKTTSSLVLDILAYFC